MISAMRNGIILQADKQTNKQTGCDAVWLKYAKIADQRKEHPDTDTANRPDRRRVYPYPGAFLRSKSGAADGGRRSSGPGRRALS